MKRILLALALLLLPTCALAQCNGVFAPQTACGTVAGGIPGQIPFSVFGGPSGATGSLQTNNGSGGFGNIPFPGGTTTFLRADGTYAAPSASVNDSDSVTNCTLAWSGAANTFGVALKTQSGADPSVAVPCLISFRNATATTGTYTSVSVTAALSFATGATGSTFGAANATPTRIEIVAFNNAGTVALGVIKAATANAITTIDETSFPTTTACNACTNATSAGVYYSTAALTTVPVRLLGYFDFNSGQTVSGVWANAPSKIQLYGRGIHKPGETFNGVTVNFAASTGSTTASATLVDTNVTAPITLISPVNSVGWSFGIQNNLTAASGTLCTLQMARGGVPVGSAVPGAFGSTAATYITVVNFAGSDFPASIGPLTYTVRIKSSAGTCSWNDSNGGGFINLWEVMN